MSDLTIYIIGISATIGFLSACIPELVAAIKATKIMGTSIASMVILMFALSGAIICNIHFKNYPFVVNDILCMIMYAVIMYNRIKKR